MLRQVGAPRTAVRRGDIQGMRAVAVLVVVLAHAGVDRLAGGFVGVDVFLVISGFLITGILVRDVRRNGRVSIADFYARRARRILPAAAVTLVAIVAMSSQVLNYLRFEQVTDDVVWAGFFAANIHLAITGADYFAADSFVSPVQHYWSLAVEEQFYLVWPALIAVVVGAGRRLQGRHLDLSGRTPRLRSLAVVLVLVCGLSLAWSVWRTDASPASAYFSTLTRGWELGIGALVAIVARRLARLPAPLKALASWAGIAAIAVAATCFTEVTPFPGHRALLPVVGAALVVAGGLDGPRYGAALVLDRAPMRWFGDISYSLYLWHWPVLVLAPIWLGRDLRPFEQVVSVGLAVLLSWLSYRMVESPARRSSFLNRRRLRALALWPAGLAIVLVAAAGIEVPGGPPAATGAPYVAPKVDPEPGTVQHSKDEAVNALGYAAELARAGYPLPARLRPSLADLRDDVSRPPARCSASRDATSHEICASGDLTAQRTIVLFGDSHIGMWLEPLEELALAGHWRIVTFTKASRFPADATLWRLDAGRPYTEGDAYQRWALQQIARIRPKRIIVSGLVSVSFAYPSGRPVPNTDSGRVFAAATERMLRKLRTLAPEVYVISGTPNLAKDPADSLAARKATRAAGASSLDPVVAERNHLWRQAAARAGAHWVDVMPWFYDGRTCPLVVGDIIVYRDDNHITTTYARTLRTGLAHRLDL